MPQKKEQHLYLTTTGRRSGKLREIEIWFTQCDGKYYVIAEYPDAKWVANIRANGEVKVRLGERVFQARGRTIDDSAEPELNARVQELSRKKYGWGDGLAVELAPTANNEAPL